MAHVPYVARSALRLGEDADDATLGQHPAGQPQRRAVGTVVVESDLPGAAQQAVERSGEQLGPGEHVHRRGARPQRAARPSRNAGVVRSKQHRPLARDVLGAQDPQTPARAAPPAPRVLRPVAALAVDGRTTSVAPVARVTAGSGRARARRRRR